MDVIQKIKDFISAKLSAEEITQLEEIAKPAPAPAPAPTPAPVALKDAKTKDGLKSLSYDGELAEGTTINETTTGVPLPAEGEYELEDGTKVTAVAGKVTKVEKPAVAPPAPGMAAQMSALTVQLAEEKASRESINKTLEELKKSNQLLAATLKKILEAPVQLPTPKAEPKSPSEMSNHEKVLASRGLL